MRHAPHSPAVPLPSGALLESAAAQAGACKTGCSLRTLQPGQVGIVQRVRKTAGMRRRLLELGFVSGTRVRVVRFAPLSDPIEVTLKGYHLSLRRAEADAVIVDLI